jgi:hypothetical protein
LIFDRSATGSESQKFSFKIGEYFRKQEVDTKFCVPAMKTGEFDIDKKVPVFKQCVIEGQEIEKSKQNTAIMTITNLFVIY